MSGEKRKYGLAITVFLICMSTFAFSCTNDHSLNTRKYSPFDFLHLSRTQTEANYSENEMLTYNFIRNQMSSPSGGVYTNYLDSQFNAEKSTGHETLSESTGLIMLYALQAKNKVLFDEQFKLCVQSLLHPTYLVRWRIRDGYTNISEASATIDDLRIIRALIIADTLWGDEKYTELSSRMSEDMLTYNIYKKSLANYYNKDFDETGQFIDLSYIDIGTMTMMVSENRRWVKIMDKGLKIVQNGMISDAFPLYYKTYDLSTDSYIEAETINIIDSLTTMLHLSEIGVLEQHTVDWLYKQIIEAGHLYSEYGIDGVPITTNESTAAYALVARIAKTTGDMQLYGLAIDRMLQFQVLDSTSVIYGSFGNKLTLEVFSYDNLQALLAY